MGVISLYEFYKKIIPNEYLIIQASPLSGNDENSKSKYSIGLSYNFLTLSNKNKKMIQIGNHENLVFSSFSTDTDWERRKNMKVNRKIIHNNLLLNGILNLKLDYKKFMRCLSKYKFVISPEGNGEDCHRHYEALLCGCIPIIECNEDIIKKYKGLPVLYTKDYSEINEHYLNLMYNKMILKKYNFNKLLINFFTDEEIKEIKEKGNFWCNKKLNLMPYN